MFSCLAFKLAIIKIVNCSKGTISIVGVLLLLIACVSQPSERLRRAAIKGDVDSVKTLLKTGANVNFIAGGWTILMFVAREGHTEIAKILLDNGADPSAKDTNGATALTISAEHGNVKIIKLLLAKGADIDVRNDHGNTALMYGAEYGHLDVIKTLLAAGADFTFKDKDGETALMTARRRKQTEIEQLLKNAGATE